MSLPKWPIMYPHTTTAQAAPIEWEVFHMDIFVASSDGCIHCGSVRAHGGKPIPWKYWLTMMVMPIIITSVLTTCGPPDAPVTR